MRTELTIMDRSLPVLEIFIVLIPPGTIQPFYYLDQVKLFILESGYVPDQGTKDPSSSLYNPSHKGASIFYPDPSTFSDHFKTTMVDISPSGSWLLIVDPSGYEPSIYVDSCVTSSEKKMRSCWLPLGYNHSSKSWSICPWSWNLLSIGSDSFNYLLNESSQHKYVENFFTTQYPCE